MRLNTIKQLILLLLGFFFWSLISCRFTAGNSSQKYFQEEILSWHNKEIIFPDTLIQFYQGKDVFYFSEIKGRNKIISFISNDCMNCTISELMFWDSFLQVYDKEFEGILILVYCGVHDYLCNVVMADIGIEIPVILDDSCFIQRKNQIFEDPMYKTALLDGSNKIVLVGDFSDNKVLEELYIMESKKLTSKQMK